MKHLPIVVVIFLFVLGCNQTAKVNKGTSENAVNTAVNDKARRANINQKISCGGLDISVGEVAIEEGKITLGLTAKNATKDVLAFYPNQKSLVIGSTQLDANMFLGEGDVSGEINVGVEKSASLVYLDKENKIHPADVKQITFHFGDVINKKSYKAAPCDITAEIK